MSSFRPLYWFKKLFGFEESVESVIQHITSKKEGDNYILTSDLNNLSYNAGDFQIRYISSFSENPERRPIRNGGTLNILVGDGYQTLDIEQIDALSMQSQPENDGATYLIASNFNCLEFTSSMQTASNGVTKYVNDLTQGPYSALACPQCAVLRNYFVEFQDKDGKKEVGQINSQINLLSKTPITVHNGYAIISEEDAEKLSKSDFNWADENNYAVGVHSNCEVIMTRAGGGCFKLIEKVDVNTYDEKEQKKLITEKEEVEKKSFEEIDQNEEKVTTATDYNDNDRIPKPLDDDVKRPIITNHVYAAALNFGGDVDKTDFTIEIASNILKAEYKAAVLAAWENSVKMESEGRAAARVLFLTLLGGGVFGNPFEIIAESIVSCKDLIVESGLDV